MNIFLHLDFLSVGVAIAATCILGFVVFFTDTKSITNKTFLTFCLLTVTWGLCNYLSYRIINTTIAFWLLRVAIFFAVWHALFLFQLLYVFPNKVVNFPKYYEYILLPIVAISSILNLTTFTFSQIGQVSTDGKILSVTNGPGIALFTLIILGLIISGIIIFIRKIKVSKIVKLKEGLPVIIGIITTFALILIFNFIFPAFLNNSKFIAFGSLFIFPFIAGVSYSIFKHQLFSVKVISTEILTFVLALVILIEATNSRDYITLFFKSTIFLLTILIGILLIKSVMNEVKQREQLQILTKELAEANSKLTALDLARAEFISIASHQLRTPPATVKWYLSAALAGDYGVLNPEVAPVIEKAAQTNNHLISLIEDMLNVSRIERGKMEFLFEQTDATELAKLAYEQLIPQSKNKKLELIFEAPKISITKIMADKEKLRQVMNNMIDNAIKYTKQGTIKVSIYQKDQEIYFAVQDSGKGIGVEDSKNIFQKYSRGKESIKQSAGLGLGLYVAKIIIEQHKGKIWAESQGEGKGSTFIFSIPINNNLKETTLVDFAKQ